MHLGLDAGDQHLVVQRPQSDRLVLVHRLAGAGRILRMRHRARSRGSAGVRKPAAPTAAGTSSAPGSTSPRRCAPALRRRAIEHPIRQRRLAQRLACVDVGLHPFGDLLPAGLLPKLERALLDAEAPAHREVHVARRVGDRSQMHGGVVEGVAHQRPQECGLRVARFAQQLQPLGRRLLQDAVDDRIGLAAARHVLAAGRVEALDVLAYLLVEARAALLAQRAGLEQLASAPAAWRSWRRTDRCRPRACPAAS